MSAKKKLVITAKNKRGSNSRHTVFQKSGLNLGGRQTVTGHVDDIVNTATDPVVSLVITAGTISRELKHVLE